VQILAMRKVVDCRARRERNLAVHGYLAAGVRVAVTGPDRAWTPMLRGSNSDYILALICKGRDGAWTRVRAGTVFELYRAAWR
jgi:hypothetical protein